MKKIIFIVVIVIIVAAAAWVGVFYWQNLRGIKPVVTGPPADITQVINTTGMPLKLPAGFSISIFAKDLPGVRGIVKDPRGNFLVSQTAAGTITQLEVQNGVVVGQSELLGNLKRPHGLALDPDDPFMLFIAEENKISRLPLYSDGPLEKIADLPAGGRHFSRTLGFGPDKRLYVSIGSSCDVCREVDPRRAAVYSLNRDGSDFKLVASGLRNSVFFRWDPLGTGMWATEMGRDMLGDDLPPDEINIIQSGKDYGWPICYGRNIHDSQFDKNVYIQNPCQEPQTIGSFIDLPAHSAPLGLAFIPDTAGWPKEYRSDVLVAYHGSWNRSQPTGYKIVRFDRDDKGKISEPEDFLSGWLTPDNSALGRPVDILADDGSIYITDDKAGVVYLVRYGQPADAEQFTTLKGNKDIIRLLQPVAGSAVSSPLVISGQARGTWFFEASFPVKLVDAANREVASGIAQAAGDWMTENYVPFNAHLEYSSPGTPAGFLILRKDNPSGLPEHDDEARIPVSFSQQNTMSVQIFFTTPETAEGPDFDCQKVASVERIVPQSTAVARVALEQLLQSPNAAETARGFGTTINPGVAIQSLTIVDGVAKVDFDKTLEQGVGGSCRVAGIRAQIEQTLKQFSSVRQVVISIDGRTEDILQP